jgi:hypothetical protein
MVCVRAPSPSPGGSAAPCGPAACCDAVGPAAPPGPSREACGTYCSRMSRTTDPGRYHLLLSLNGRPAMHGWWDDEATARRQCTGWIGARGRPGARITLVNEETGTLLAEWPDD